MADYMELQRLQKGLIDKNTELAKAVGELNPLAEKSAEAERNYLSAMETTILKLENEGKKTTIMKDLAKGKTADYLFKFRVASAAYKTGNANVKRLHSNIDTYRSLISTAKAEIKIL